MEDRSDCEGMEDEDPQAAAAAAEWLEVDRLVANTWNPNVQTDAEFKRLVEEIKEVGFIDFPQVIPMDDGTYRIIGGEHRVAAAKELGFRTLPCAVLTADRWQEEDLQKLVTVRLNVMGGKLDPARMAALYDEMAKKYQKESLQKLFAYTDKAKWDTLLDAIGRAVKQAGVTPEKAAEFQEKAKEAKTVRDVESILNELFSSYGDTVQQSFMVFTYGSKEHIYVQMNKDTHKAMKTVMKHCVAMGKDINDLVGVALRELAKALGDEKKAAKNKKPADTEVPF